MIFFTDGSGNGGFGFVCVEVLEDLTGESIVKQVCRIPVTEKITNNRAELSGIILALEYMLEHHTTENCIVSDSLISIKTLTEWLPKRLRDGTQAKLQNLDLLMKAHSMLTSLNVKFRHVNSHQKAVVGGAEYYYYLGNNMIDQLIA